MAAVLIPLPNWHYAALPPAAGRFVRGLGAAAVLPSPGLQSVANTIITTENANPALNNPGNLMYAGQAGASGSPGQLATFDSYGDGLQALYNQLGLYANRGMTISQMTAVYAPAGIPGNDPVAYANYISSAAGVSPDTSLAAVIAGGGSSVDTGNTLDLTDTGAGWSFDPSTLVDTISSDLGSVDPVVLAGAAIGGLLLLWLVARR